MGFLDWIKGLFSSQGYDSKSGLRFVKKTEKYRIIAAEDRPGFEKIFLEIAKNEIARLNRLLTEEEINIVAQRARIRFTQKTRVVKGAEKYQILNNEWKTLKVFLIDFSIVLARKTAKLSDASRIYSLEESQRTGTSNLQQNREELLKMTQNLMAKAKSKAGYFPEIDELLKQEIQELVELINQVDARIQERITKEEFLTYYRNASMALLTNKRALEKKLAA